MERESVTAEKQLERLLKGNRRFALGEAPHADISATRRRQLVQSQQPFAMVLACSDSRVPPEIIFDCSLGDLFVIRTAGHTIDETVRESLLFGIQTLNISLLVVLGHMNCGAVSMAIQQGISSRLEDSFIARQIYPAVKHGIDKGDALNSAIKAHILYTVSYLKQFVHPIRKEVMIQGMYYNLESGIVEVLQAARNQG